MATPKPKPSPSKKAQLTVVLPNGTRGGAKDIRTNSGTPKPKVTPKATPGKMTPEDAAMLKYFQKIYPDMFPTKKR